jgi:hypothetical protein
MRRTPGPVDTPPPGGIGPWRAPRAATGKCTNMHGTRISLPDVGVKHADNAFGPLESTRSRMLYPYGDHKFCDPMRNRRIFVFFVFLVVELP